MKKLLIIVVAISFLLPVTNAQLWKLHRYEITAGIGTTQFYGDIGGYPNEKNILGIKDFTFLQTRININGSMRYRVSETVSARVNLGFGLLHSTDARGSNVERKYESSTIYFEPSLIVEYYFIKNKGENSFLFMQGDRTIIKSFFSSLDFYAFTGFGGLAYHVSPNNILSPTVTKSGGFTGVVPVGLGVTMIYSANVNFGIEFGGWFTNSDNLEGFSAPHSLSNDIFHTLNFNFTYKIKTGRNGLPKIRK
jgi:hypothetical protein